MGILRRDGLPESTMLSPQIRRTFLDFFGRRDHPLIPSSSLIPDDPNLLTTNAGMVPFVPYFAGAVKPVQPRAMSLQKCVRTNDIEQIGQTTRHATCFEMLGSFSFGDYYKETIIPWAYELLTEGYGLDPRRLWATVLDSDTEAYALWREVGLPEERIQRLGLADNFWSTGAPGPAGNNTEVFYDRGDRFGRDGGPAVNSERFLELWGLVFIHLLRGDSDEDIRGELPMRGIDTGMGLDRVALVLQDVEHICETDLVRPTLERLEQAVGGKYRASERKLSYRIVTDHVRAAAFLIADGILPGNEGRGYVLRRLLRRAVRHGRLLGVDKPFLTDLTATVVANLGGQWPELVEREELIDRVVAHEEEAFERTLKQGSRLLDTAIRRSHGSLSGTTAFELHDTYGFPVDLTAEIAADAGLTLDRGEFGRLMEEQRRRAQAARRSVGASGPDVYTHFTGTRFVGYEDLEGESVVLGLVRDGIGVEVATQGQTVEVILDRSPFYAEAGGQVGDRGVIRGGDSELRVLGTRYGVEGLHVHSCEVVRGVLMAGEEVEAVVDGERRAATARAHSATHVLHAVLRKQLGEHAQQHGSLVEPGRLRFDFTHFDALDPGRLSELEDEVNSRILANPEVRVWHAGREEAQKAGATALFGEKYGDVVRIVDIGDFSRELCGGTHIGYGAMAGPVRVLGESSIGAGLRRVEALVGMDALRHSDRERRVLGELTRLIGVPGSARTSRQEFSQPDSVVETLSARLAALSDAERRLAAYREKELDVMASELATEPAVTRIVSGVSGAELRSLAQKVVARGARAVVLGSQDGGKAQLVAVVTEELGVPAVTLLRDAAGLVGGGAGGTGLIANAGGRNVSGLSSALEVARTAALALITR
jgi:alanyl-tRNA synthetase